MIDQQLGLNILNNLLCIQISEENSGDAEQKDQALNSSFVTTREEDAAVCFKFTNYELTNINEKEGGYDPNGLGTSKNAPYVLPKASDIFEAYNTKEEIQARYTLPKMSGTKKIEKIFLPIGEVNPEVSKVNKEKAKINPIGMLESQLTSFLNEINDLNVISYSNNTSKQTTFSSELSKLNTNVQSVATRFKTEVLDNLPYYRASVLNPAYTYEIDKTGVEKGTQVTVNKKINITYYFLKEEKHYFKIPVGTTGYALEFDCTYSYYDYSKDEINCTLISWYYSQTFSTKAYYPERAFIGLFTDYNHSHDTERNANGMPNSDGTKFREPPHKNENTPGGNENYTYQRMDLHRGLFTDGYVFEDIKKAREEDAEGKDSPTSLIGKAFIKNREIIMFPEILHQGEGETKGWGNIYGFGIFTNEIPQEGEKPYFWGPVMNAPISTKEGEVPLFRPEQFEVFLG